MMEQSNRLKKKKRVYFIWLLIMTFTAIVTPKINDGKGWYLVVLVPFAIYQMIAYIYECYDYEQRCEKKDRETYMKEQNKVLDEYTDNMMKLRFDKIMKNVFQQLKYTNTPEFAFKDEFDDYKKIYKFHAIQMYTVLFFVWLLFVNWG